MDTASVAAVVTAHNPDARLADGVRSVIGQVDRVVVVDDGSDSESCRAVFAEVESLGAQVIRLGSNRGIAAALNAGLAELEANAPLWVLTLDQDSSVPGNYVAELVGAGTRARSRGVRVGMVAPGHAESVGGRRPSPTPDGETVLGGEPISSGLLVPWSTHDMLGRYDEDLFIDGVDTEFWLRSQAAGLAVVVAPSASLGHRLGRAHRVRLGPLVFDQTTAATFRYYYQLRNLVHLQRRHALQNPRWAVRAVVAQARHLALVSLFVPGRRQRLAEAARGLCAGLQGATGRRPA